MKQFLINLWNAQKNAEALGNWFESKASSEIKLRVAAIKYRTALHNIAAQETPSANATVKRMARIAREALK